MPRRDSADQETFVDSSSSRCSSPGPDEVPKIIPPTHRHRTLVLCFDGTGDQFDEDNSNIVELFSMLKRDDRRKQMVYYQAGIGTHGNRLLATPLASKISKSMDEAIAWNLSAHVMDGYEFLMENYQDGDRICIFGFSRGAYTARGLAGMIHKVGLLPACNFQQVKFAYRMYKRDNELGWRQSVAFKKSFSVDVEIEFLGLWDTVNSVGFVPRRLPFTTSNTIVRTFRHALALDERRAKFKANHWHGLDFDYKEPPSQATLHAREKPKKNVANQNGTGGEPVGDPNKKGRNTKLRNYEQKFSLPAKHPTDVEEVWFVGSHCDVGGGSVTNHTPDTLARIPLRWMIRECFKAKTGIMFVSDSLPDIGLDPASLYPEVKPRPPALSSAGYKIQAPLKVQPNLIENEEIEQVYRTEEEHEVLDAIAPIYDQLLFFWLWWILELIPFRQRWRNADGSWETSRWFNLGRGRDIPRQKTGIVKVHRSVKLRMEAEHEDGSKYTPKASFQTALDLGHLEWVD